MSSIEKAPETKPQWSDTTSSSDRYMTPEKFALLTPDEKTHQIMKFYAQIMRQG